ncbi:MAG: tetratricopeptide repeat protein [Candidatus Methylacidiphilales bacterium]
MKYNRILCRGLKLGAIGLFGLLMTGWIANHSLGQDAKLPAAEADQLLKEGTEAYDDGNFGKAVTQLTRYVEGTLPSGRNHAIGRYLLGISHYNLSQYKEAATYLEKDEGLPEDLISNSQFHHAVSHYFMGGYEKAIEILKKMVAPPPVDPKAKTPPAGAKAEEPKEAKEADPIRPFALFYLGRAYMEWGLKLDNTKNDKPGAKNAWTEGVKVLSDYLKEFPEDSLVPDALITRATIHLYSENFSEAEADLVKLKTLPGGDGMAQDADYMLGFVLSQQASRLLADSKREEAAEVIQRARQTYGTLAQSDNLMVANEAAFQLANLDFAEKKYEEAIQAYRLLKSKKQVIEVQNQRIESLRREVAGAAKEPARFNKIQRALKREEQKLESLKGNPELALEALIKVGEVFLQLRQFDKSRVIFRHAKTFSDEEQKKRLEVQIIVSHAAQGNADIAEKLFTEFKGKHPNDPQAQSVKFLLGSAFLQQGRHEDAIKAFDESLKEFPDSPSSAQIPKLKAQAYMGMGRKEEAMKSFRDFIADATAGKIKVAPEVVDDTKRLLAFALYGEKKVDEALALLKELAANATAPAIREEAAFQNAFLESQRGQAGAEKLFIDFAAQYPDSANAPRALMQAGNILEKGGNLEEARAIYEKVINQYADNSMALLAHERIWRSHGENMEKVLEAQDRLIAAFPQSDRALAALFERGKLLDQKKDFPGSANAYLKVYEVYSSLPATARTERLDQFGSLSLISASLIRQKEATALGKYSELNAEEKKQWENLLEESAMLLEKVVVNFPGSRSQSNALKRLSDVLLNLMAQKVVTREQILERLGKVAATVTDESSRTQIMIAQAGLLNQTGESRQALLIYEQAFNQLKDLSTLPWQDLDQYGTLLLENQQWQKALDIFEKMQQTSKEDQKHALAAAVYGQGAALQGLGKTNEAAPFFKRLQEEFPWSPKILDAQYGSAFSLYEKGQYQDAIEALKEIVRSGRSSNENKARSMILIARSLFDMGQKGMTTPETKQEDGKDMDINDLACNYLAKVEVFYAESLPLFSSEALYRAVEIRKKQGKNTEATQLLNQLLDEYTTTPWAQRARTDF